ncbi:MAG: protein-glutamine glutaminase family protein [Myxococcota bacterium]
MSSIGRAQVVGPLQVVFSEPAAIEIKTAMSAFDAIRTSGIEFRYPQGGCHARAHAMSRVLSSRSIAHGKVWVFSPSSIVMLDPNAVSEGGRFTWGYHVAPFVNLQGGGKAVFDPSLFGNGPVRLENWLGALDCPACKVVFVDKEYYSFNTTAGAVSGFWKCDGGCGEQKWFEEELALNDVAMALITRLKAPAVEAAERAAAESLVGNICVLGRVFRPSLKKNTCSPDVAADFEARNKGLLDRYRGTFTERVKHWSSLR